MKKVFRLSTVIFIILALLLSTFPASASVTKSYFEGFSKTMPNPVDDPNQRWWPAGLPDGAAGYAVSQTRNATRLMEFIVDEGDERFAGFNVAEMNLIFHVDAEGALIGARFLYKSVTYQNSDYTDPIWTCSSQGSLDSSWNFNINGVCQGVGEYKGLTAKFTVGNTMDGINYPIEGYILE